MNYVFFEFDAIPCGERGLPPKAFEELKSLIVTDDAPRSEGSIDCFSLGAKGGREVILCRNYVGIVFLPCGASVEILPKIGRQDRADLSRRLVVEMLKACGVLPYRSFQNADVKTASLNLFEIYIRLFLNELYALWKKGLRSGYVTEDSNETFLRGKLLFKEQIGYNCAHGERFFVAHDEYDLNRAENRILKSTLLFVQRISRDEGNKRDIRRFLSLFDEIARSENVEADLARCVRDKTVRDYSVLMKLCSVFLRKRGFTMYGGRFHVPALLFPMETLYERFIAHEMRRHTRAAGWEQIEQGSGMSLFDGRRFALRPDILLRRGDRTVILDTKWKRLSSDRENYGISQSDMYQMYAYHTRYPNVSQVIMLYPLYEFVPIGDFVIRDKNVRIRVLFFDLYAYMNGASFGACVYPRQEAAVGESNKEEVPSPHAGGGEV